MLLRQVMYHNAFLLKIADEIEKVTEITAVLKLCCLSDLRLAEIVLLICVPYIF